MYLHALTYVEPELFVCAGGTFHVDGNFVTEVWNWVLVAAWVASDLVENVRSLPIIISSQTQFPW